VRAIVSPSGGALNSLLQCFSTGVPRNLRVPPVVSKGSAGPPVLSTKKLHSTRHLRPLDAFSRPLVLCRSKMYLWSGLRPKPRLQRSSRPLPGGRGSLPPPKNPSPLSAFEFRPSGVHKRHRFREQSKLLQTVPLHCEAEPFEPSLKRLKNTALLNQSINQATGIFQVHEVLVELQEFKVAPVHLAIQDLREYQGNTAVVG